MRVLVTGAGGLLGGRLAALLQEGGFDVVAAYRCSVPPPGPRHVRLDLTNLDELGRILDSSRPDAVLHAAAFSRIDRCFERPADAEAVNARLPGSIAGMCRDRGLRLVALSTDLVFSGREAPLREDAAAHPLSVYGRTKLAGEEAVLANHPEAAVARVALVTGRGHGSRGTSSESVAWALRAGAPVTLFTDEYRTPVDPESLADAIARLLTRPAPGRFHLGGPERLSRFELGRRLALALGLGDRGIRPGRQSDHPAPEPRAADVSLDCTRARRELGWEPRPIDEALRESRLAPE